MRPTMRWQDSSTDILSDIFQQFLKDFSETSGGPIVWMASDVGFI